MTLARRFDIGQWTEVADMMRRRGGPGVLSTMARTAVIAGTATAVSNKVNQAGAAKAAARQQQQAAQHAAVSTQGQIEHLQGQLAGMQAQQAETAALGGGGAMMAQLQQLVQLREEGMLTDEEFSQAKARLLAG
jgi:hypothetical protein